MRHIQNPLEWLWSAANTSTTTVGSATPEEYWAGAPAAAPVGAPRIRHIEVRDLAIALTRGIADFRASRTDVVMIALIYPTIGLLFAFWGSGYELLPLLFPLAFGFALIGPFAAIGLYEMSRRREGGHEVTWLDAAGVLRSPQIGSIAGLGTLLIALFLAWLASAQALYNATLGPAPPVSIPGFVQDIFTTAPGLVMLGAGIAIGIGFAVVVLAISVVSFPLLLDRKVSLGMAMLTSMRALIENPGPLTLWALIVAGSLVAGALPVLVGLAVVLPVLGHSTWHLYRRIVR